MAPQIPTRQCVFARGRRARDGSERLPGPRSAARDILLLSVDVLNSWRHPCNRPPAAQAQFLSRFCLLSAALLAASLQSAAVLYKTLSTKWTHQQQRFICAAGGLVTAAKIIYQVTSHTNRCRAVAPAIRGVIPVITAFRRAIILTDYPL